MLYTMASTGLIAGAHAAGHCSGMQYDYFAAIAEPDSSRSVQSY
jgi:hypothetical protein